MPFDGQRRFIKVVEAKKTVFDNGGELVTVVDENNKKYKINRTKQDGTVSKAWQQMQKLGMDFLGATIEIGFKETPGKPFTNKDGKLVEYTNRYISFLSKADAPETPVTSMAVNEIRSRTAPDKDFLQAIPKQSEQTPDEEVTVEDIPF